MKRKATLLIILALLLNTIIWAQNEGKKKQLFIDGHKQLQLGNTEEALKIFNHLYELNPACSNYNYLIGSCYFSMDKKEDKLKAIPYLEKAVKNLSSEYKEAVYKEPNAPQIALYYLAQTYFLNYDFDNAIKYFDQYRIFIKDPSTLQEFEMKTAWALKGKELIKTPVEIDIINLGENINSEFDDHSPVIDISETKMVFTSKRKGSTGNLKTTDGQYFEDIYISKKENDKWNIPEKISYNINTMEHEASIALSVDGKELFIYKDDVGEGGNLYRSVFIDEESDWSKPEKLGSNINTEFDEGHATISPDGSVLYFTSNRPGGYGGFDIYYVNRLPNGEWGIAQNLGNSINTNHDEAGPFMHQDGTVLYFSSNGNNSMGGYDLFFTILKDDKTFAKPQNLGYPINTIEDDVFYVLSKDEKRAYYSTEKKNSFGGKDIYLMDLTSLPERSLVVVSGHIHKMGSNDPVKNAVLSINDAKTGELVGTFKPNKTTGKYLLILPKAKSEYTISCDQGEFVNTRLTVPEESNFYYLRAPIIIEPIGILK